MSTDFKREERYIVFKLSDLGNSLKGDEIRRLAREYAEQRRLKGKKPLECVVVEKDWPEYEPTWKAIEACVNGAQPAPSTPEFCPCCGNIMRACMSCPNEDCNAVTVTAEQAKYNKQHAAAALTAYAADCETTHPELAKDLREKWGAQPAPSVPEGWIQRGMAELEAIRSRQDDDTLLDDRTLIERIGKAMLAAAPEAKP